MTDSYDSTAGYDLGGFLPTGTLVRNTSGYPQRIRPLNEYKPPYFVIDKSRRSGIRRVDGFEQMAQLSKRFEAGGRDPWRIGAEFLWMRGVKVWVSSVFTGVGFDFDGPPQPFETMVFIVGRKKRASAHAEDVLDHMTLKSATLGEAKRTHADVCRAIRADKLLDLYMMTWGF